MIAKKREMGEPSEAQLAAQAAFAERRRAEVAAKTNFAPEQAPVNPVQEATVTREEGSTGAQTPDDLGKGSFVNPAPVDEGNP